jgi:hypothetical protein
VCMCVYVLPNSLRLANFSVCIYQVNTLQDEEGFVFFFISFLFSSTCESLELCVSEVLIEFLRVQATEKLSLCYSVAPHLVLA